MKLSAVFICVARLQMFRHAEMFLPTAFINVLTLLVNYLEQSLRNIEENPRLTVSVSVEAWRQMVLRV